MKAEQVLTANYEWTDEPLDIGKIDGLPEAVSRIQEAQEGKEFVRCENRVPDYDVYWNETTESVRIAAKPNCVSYELDESETTLGDFE